MLSGRLKVLKTGKNGMYVVKNSWDSAQILEHVSEGSGSFWLLDGEALGGEELKRVLQDGNNGTPSNSIFNPSIFVNTASYTASFGLQ